MIANFHPVFKLASVVVPIATGAFGIVVGFLIRSRSRPAGSESGDAHSAPLGSVRSSAASGADPGEKDEKSDTTDFMLGIVNVIDQIELSKAHAGAESLPTLTGIQASLRDQVDLAGGELIQETGWNPAVQRAVKVETAPSGQVETLFPRSLSTGLRYRSRIVRKQEVAISQPSAPS